MEKRINRGRNGGATLGNISQKCYDKNRWINIGESLMTIMGKHPL